MVCSYVGKFYIPIFYSSEQDFLNKRDLFINSLSGAPIFRDYVQKQWIDNGVYKVCTIILWLSIS